MFVTLYTEEVPVAEHNGYRIISQIRPDGWRDDRLSLHVVNEEGKEVGQDVEVKFPDTDTYWGNDTAAQVTVQHMQEEDSAVILLQAEALVIAAGLADALNEAYAADREAAERKRQEEREARLRSSAVSYLRKRKMNAAIKEEVQWLVDQNGRLTRHGYRSTVQVRPIIRVDDSSMVIRTERGDTMYIYFNELATLDIKYEGERRFTKIDIPKEEDFEVTEEEIEAYVQERA